MAFRIRADEKVARAIHRLARKQLREASHALQGERPFGDGIHHLRTSLKKARALAALVRPAVGRRARRAERRLRRLTATTSRVRDADVLRKTFDALLGATGDELPPSLRRARGRLETQARRLAREIQTDGGAERLVRKLRRARRRCGRWMPRRSSGWRVVRRGLVVSYRRACKAMSVAYEEKSGEAFHRWRKAVKTHRYQLKLLEEVWPGESTAHVEALDRLGELLGEEHDLTVLEQVIDNDHRCFAREEDRARLYELIDRRRYTVRAEARALGERLFAERPRAFGHRLRDELDVELFASKRDGQRDAGKHGLRDGEATLSREHAGHGGGAHDQAAAPASDPAAWPDPRPRRPGPAGLADRAFDIV